MASSFALYDPSKLPAGFRYPKLLQQIATGNVPTYIEPWWFVDATSEAGELFLSVREGDGRNLVPFAKMDDDIACFDGDDHTDDPAVVALVLDGSGRRYGFESFSAWLLEARSTSA